MCIFVEENVLTPASNVLFIKHIFHSINLNLYKISKLSQNNMLSQNGIRGNHQHFYGNNKDIYCKLRIWHSSSAEKFHIK